MSPEQQPRTPDAVGSAAGTAGPVTKVSDRFIVYLIVFLFLVFLLYVLPEVMVFKQYGFAPVEHLVDTGTNPSLGDILTSLWMDRAEVLNPMNNTLVRFFLVTAVVGIVFDRVKQHAPSTGERS